MKSYSIFSALGIFLLSLFADISYSFADGLALEEIVVTARKREESLMEIPMSITAMSAETLEKMNLTQMDEIATYTPGFHYVEQVGGGSGRGDRSGSSLVFRGLFLGTAAQGQAAGGLLFIDGAPVIGGQAPTLIDFERVEVLKGPQSAYFGRSVLSGAINYVSRDPNDEQWGGKVVAVAGSRQTQLAQVSVEGPITDALAVRLSASYDAKGGHYENAAQPGEKLGDRTSKSFALQAKFTPTDSLTAKVYFNVMEHDDGPPAHASLKGSAGDFNCTPGGRAFGYFCGELPGVKDLAPGIISSNYDLSQFGAREILLENSAGLPVAFDPSFIDGPGLRRIAINTHARVDYETSSGMTVTTLTAYHSDKDMSVIDLNFRDRRDVVNPFGFFIPGAPLFNRWQLAVQGKFQDLSQELRISSSQDNAFRWTIGGNYLHTKSPGGSVYGLSPFGPGFFSARTEFRTKTPAVFGGIQYDLTDALTLSLDARYQWDELKQQVKITSTGQPPTGPGAGLLNETFTSFSPRVSIDYNYADGSTAYLLFARGYRPGGFNAVLQGAPASVQAQFGAFNAGLAFEEEKLDNYEIGLKNTWAEGRLQTRLAIYHNPYTNGQNQITIPFLNPDGSLNLASVFVNTGKIDLEGFEFEFDAVPFENFTLSGTLGMADSEVKEYFCGDGVSVSGSPDCNGNLLPSASKWTWSLSADYSHPLAGDYDWFGRVDWSHKGKYFVDYSNAAFAAPSDIVNVRLGIRSDYLSFEGYIENLLDEDDPPSAVIGNDLFTCFPCTNEIRYTLARKQTVGVKATYNF